MGRKLMGHKQNAKSKIKDEVVEEPKIKNEAVEKPKIKDEVVEEPKIKNEVVEEPMNEDLFQQHLVNNCKVENNEFVEVANPFEYVEDSKIIKDEDLTLKKEPSFIINQMEQTLSPVQDCKPPGNFKQLKNKHLTYEERMQIIRECVQDLQSPTD